MVNHRWIRISFDRSCFKTEVLKQLLEFKTLIRQFIQAAESCRAGGTDNGVKRTDVIKQLVDRIFGSKVNSKIPAAVTDLDQVVVISQQLYDSFSNGAAGTDDDYFHLLSSALLRLSKNRFLY